MLEQTKRQLASLKFEGMLLALEEQIANPPTELSFEDRVALLVDREHLHRENKRLLNRLRNAKLKAGCAFEKIEFNVQRAVDKSKLLTLSNGAWIKQHRSIIITGPTGTGKTFIAQALAHNACLKGYTARYYRLLHLMHDSVIAYREGKLQRFLTRLVKFDVLIIDDFGMMSMDDEQKRMLLEVIENRYEQSSTIITSQLPYEQWYDHLNDPLIADALLDRVVHQAEKIQLSGESMRKLKHQSIEQAQEETP